MKKLLAAVVILWAAPARAGLYYDLQQNTSAFMRVGGNIKIADPASPMTPTITLDGVGGSVSAKQATLSNTGSAAFALTVSTTIKLLAGGIMWADGTTSTTASAGGGATSDPTKVAKAGDFMTGQLTIGNATFTVTGLDGNNDAAHLFGNLLIADGFSVHWSGGKVLGGATNLVLNAATGGNSVLINNGASGAAGTRGLYVYDGALSSVVKMRFDPTTDSAIATKLRIGDTSAANATLDVNGTATISSAPFSVNGSGASIYTSGTCNADGSMTAGTTVNSNGAGTNVLNGILQVRGNTTLHGSANGPGFLNVINTGSGLGNNSNASLFFQSNSGGAGDSMQMGFGVIGTSHPNAQMAYLFTSGAGTTGAGDLVIYNKASTSDVAPTEAVRVKSDLSTAFAAALHANNTGNTAAGFSVITSSGIQLGAGGIMWADGTTSTTAVVGGGGGGATSFNVDFSSWVGDTTGNFTTSGTKLGPCMTGSTVTVTTCGNCTRILVDYHFVAALPVSDTSRSTFLVDGKYVNGDGPTIGKIQQANGGPSGGAWQFGTFAMNIPPEAVTVSAGASHSVCLSASDDAGSGINIRNNTTEPLPYVGVQSIQPH